MHNLLPKTPLRLAPVAEPAGENACAPVRLEAWLGALPAAARGEFFIAALRVSNLASLQKILPSHLHEALDALLLGHLRRFCSHLSCPMIERENRAVFLLAFASTSGAEDVAKSLHAGISATFSELEIEEFCLCAEIEIGLARLGEDAAASILCARKASLFAKEGYATYTPTLDAAIRAEEALCADLARAISSGSICVQYQPKLDGASKIIGAEALVRLRKSSATAGLAGVSGVSGGSPNSAAPGSPGSPGSQAAAAATAQPSAPAQPTAPTDSPSAHYFSAAHFIELAERHGLIFRLEELVIARVCEDLAKLGAMGLSTTVSINITPRHLQRAGLADYLCARAAEHGIAHELIELEITEREQLSAAARGQIARLAALGFAISLDDFGKDYSSLCRLSELPVNVLKIDKIFIDGLAPGASNYDIAHKICKAIITMAKDMGKKVIAEGVESAEQIEALRAMGCDAVQGFYHYRALDFEDFYRALLAHR